MFSHYCQPLCDFIDNLFVNPPVLSNVTQSAVVLQHIADYYTVSHQAWECDPQKDLVEEPHINGWQDVFDAIQIIKDEEKKLMVLLVQAKDELDRLLLQDQRIKDLGITSLIEILEKKK